MTKDNLLSLVANLIQELLDLGYKQEELKWMLKQYGMSYEQMKEWYGL